MTSHAARQRATLQTAGHRPWPLPAGRWAMGQTWDELLFAHWRVPVAPLRRHVPQQLELDTHAGEAWLGVSPFVVRGLHLRRLPPLPLASSFLELNVRTYVTYRGEKPGIWFFSLDASSRLAVQAARHAYRLPYYRARMRPPPAYRCARVGDRRPHEWDGAYGPTGPRFLAGPGSLEYFLAERYCLYTVDGAGVAHRADIHHPPWTLQPARVELARMTMPPDGLDIGRPPEHVMYSARQDVLIWRLQRA